ncbi:MAG: DUF4397 domain-containing protein, partial [Bdellovibrionales bacterium]|nr:DUF4397 domain-containing protein [Bdellovibrionales bacterium]
MRLIRFAFLLLIGFSFGCGGGGGGSDTSNDKYGIRVLHGSLQSTPLEYSDPKSSETPLRVMFLGESLYKTFPTGPVSFGLFSANSGLSDLRNGIEFEVAEKTRYTVLLTDDPITFSSHATILEDSLPDLSDTIAFVRFVNAVTDSSAVTVTVTGTTQPIGIAPRQASEYLEVPIDTIRFGAKRASDGQSLLIGKEC